MISKNTYTIEHVVALRDKYKKDPSLLDIVFAENPYQTVETSP